MPYSGEHMRFRGTPAPLTKPKKAKSNPLGALLVPMLISSVHSQTASQLIKAASCVRVLLRQGMWNDCQKSASKFDLECCDERV